MSNNQLNTQEYVIRLQIRLSLINQDFIDLEKYDYIRIRLRIITPTLFRNIVETCTGKYYE